ncbi:STOREKEEPER protein-like [Rutidosis leptorrhynchoides]|uniref:STOREKEEPER protein-like n=1 Tax=Rutidosis leptorrhynchoides TaxID=125765 RepID=UPI003A9A2E89
MSRKPPSAERNPSVDSPDEENEINDDREEQTQGGSRVKKHQLDNTSSEDIDSDSDADSEDTHASPMASAFTIKMRDDVTTSNKVSAGSKRPIGAISADGIESSRKKAKASASSAREGKSQRVWSVDDEIALLKQMIEYRRVHNSEPIGTHFFEYIKNSLPLNFELNRTQLVDKIYRLRKKYEANLNNAGGEDPEFAKPHDREGFELSKKMWGSTKAKTKKSKNSKQEKTSNVPVVKPCSKSKKNASSVVQANVVDAKVDASISNDHGGKGKARAEFWSKFSPLSTSLGMEKALALPDIGKKFIIECIAKRGSMAEGVEAKWKVLQERELELNLKRIDVVKEQQKLALDLIRASEP